MNTFTVAESLYALSLYTMQYTMHNDKKFQDKIKLPLYRGTRQWSTQTQGHTG